MKDVIQVLVDQFAYTPQPWEILFSALLIIVVCQLTFCEMWEIVARGKKIPQLLILPGFVGMLTAGFAFAFFSPALGTLFIWISLMHAMKAPAFIICMGIACLLFGLYQQARTICKVQKIYT